VASAGKFVEEDVEASESSGDDATPSDSVELLSDSGGREDVASTVCSECVAPPEVNSCVVVEGPEVTEASFLA
jgi:hypothetical protein